MCAGKVTPLLLIVAGLAVGGCAPVKPPPAPSTTRAPEVTPESLAVEAERELNAAEHELSSLHLEEAEKHLENADRSFRDSRIDRYPDTKVLKERHEELVLRVPKVREEVRRRELAAAVSEARARIDGTLSELKTALVDIKKKHPSESELKRARELVDALKKALEDASALETKDVEYAKFALGVQKQVQGQRKAVDDRELEVAIDDANAEISRVEKDLASALAALKRPDVAEGEFETAKKMADAVDAVLVKTEPLAARATAVRDRLTRSREALKKARASIDARALAVAVGRQKRSLGDALTTLAKAQKPLRSPSDLEAAEGAAGAVEKVLEAGKTFRGQDPSYAQLAVRAEKAIASAKASIAERRDVLATEDAQAKTKTELEALRAAVSALEGFSVSDAQFAAAVSAAEGVEKSLAESAELEKKIKQQRVFATEARERVKTARARIEKRRLEITIRERRMLIEDALADGKRAVKAAEQPGAKSEDIKSAIGKLKAMKEELEKSRELELKDRKFEAFVTASRKEANRIKTELEGAEEAASFREGPIARMSEGLDLLRSIGTAAPDDQKKTYETAIEHFRACQKDGATILANRPRLSTVTFVVPEKKTKASGVLTLCADHAKSTRSKLEALKARISFQEGPGKSFEKAKALLAARDGAQDPTERMRISREALTELESCLESGRMLEHRYPELKSATFEIAGKQVKLPAVVAECQGEAKEVRRLIGTK